MKTGRVRLYEGVINKSGKSVFSFSGVKLVHRSVKADKSDYIVHQETGAIMFAMPIGSERSRALDYLAKHIERLLAYNTEPTSYELYKQEQLPKMTKQQRIEAERVPHKPISKTPSYSDRGCVAKPKTKRTFDMRYAKW
ncbi:hypothetical protein OAE88_00555 [bacterium]|nr:hypothetical protein [bacterium]